MAWRSEQVECGQCGWTGKMEAIGPMGFLDSLEVKVIHGERRRGVTIKSANVNVDLPMFKGIKDHPEGLWCYPGTDKPLPEPYGHDDGHYVDWEFKKEPVKA